MNFKLFILFIALVTILKNECPSGNERIEPIDTEFEQEVFRLTNIERKKHGLKAFKWDEKLAYAARYHASDMAKDNYFDHDSYDRKGESLEKSCSIFDRIEAFITYPYLAENISAGRTSPEDVVQAWMKSQGHRKNILNKNLSKLGVGYYYQKSSEYGYYWVQNFGGE